eukprot:TRINITY_DN324_c0_g1_i20.p2 TRINITY_DN324_c0_g1~~TRINITY_DN324_c0_g1_i20.p2  ORF type:complete len:115 (-),score=18.46 TRINITY_DN324_c0_g1_i20:2443-2787(-)
MEHETRFNPNQSNPCHFISQITDTYIDTFSAVYACLLQRRGIGGKRWNHRVLSNLFAFYKIFTITLALIPTAFGNLVVTYDNTAAKRGMGRLPPRLARRASATTELEHDSLSGK